MHLHIEAVPALTACHANVVSGFRSKFKKSLACVNSTSTPETFALSGPRWHHWMSARTCQNRPVVAVAVHFRTDEHGTGVDQRDQDSHGQWLTHIRNGALRHDLDSPVA